MAKVDDARALVEPLAVAAGVDVYDVTMHADTLVVSLTRPGGIDLETLTRVSRQLNAALEEHDPHVGTYAIEVSSPGLERTLRTAEHFAGAIGDEVTMRTRPDADGERRVKGVVRAADATTVTVALEDGAGDRVVPIEAIERARTVFRWEPTPKTGGKANQPKAGKAKSGSKSGQKKPKQSAATEKKAPS